MVSILERVITFVIVRSLSVFYSIITVFGLLFAYITNFMSMPWKPRDRTLMEPPVCLSDPKYGKHKYITLSNKVRLHYVESGDDKKPLMVFIHGFPEFWYSWRHQITEFSKDYWVIAVDLRGFSLSDKPREIARYKLDLLVDDIKELIERLDRKQCILVAHDWGAIIGFEFVSKYRHMVHKYVMMGAPSMRVYNKIALSKMDQFKKSWYYFMFLMPSVAERWFSYNDFDFFHFLWNKKFNDNFTEEDLEAYKYVYSKPGALTASISIYRANSSFVSEPRASDDDGSNGLFIMGQRDDYVSQIFCIQMAVEHPKLRVEVIPNANHFVHQDKPEAINSLIHEFLGSPSKYVIEKFS